MLSLIHICPRPRNAFRKADEEPGLGLAGLADHGIERFRGLRAVGKPLVHLFQGDGVVDAFLHVIIRCV